EFLVFDGYKYQSVESPIEENQKRIQTLRKALAENKIIPRRMGISFRPKIQSYVLVSPGANVLRPPPSTYDTSSIVTADYLTQTLLKQVERIKRFYQKLKRLPKAFDTDTLEKAAGKLASLNAPNPIDYRRLFCPEENWETSTTNRADGDIPFSNDFVI
ncbi:MAG: hypothetical protein JSW26_10550, partial [Desulfobacterales bacterium]